MQDNGTVLQAIAFILGIAAVCYSVITTCVESRAMDLEAQRVEDSELLPYRPEFFHAIFGLASAYLCMLHLLEPGHPAQPLWRRQISGRATRVVSLCFSSLGDFTKYAHPIDV